MKRLQPKNTAEAKKVTRANLILAKARKELKSHICSTAAYLYKAIYGNMPNFEEDENCSICTGDLVRNIYINSKVSRSYAVLDVEDNCYEDVEIAEITCLLDDTVTVADEDGNEWTDDELSIEELAEIADAFELTYDLKCKGLLHK